MNSSLGGAAAQTMKRPITLPVLEGIYGKGAKLTYLEGRLMLNGEVIQVRRNS